MARGWAWRGRWDAISARWESFRRSGYLSPGPAWRSYALAGYLRGAAGPFESGGPA